MYPRAGNRMPTRALVAAALLCSCASTPPVPEGPRSMSYEDLLSVFAGWRSFQRPRLVDGVPDYTGPAMSAQHRELAGWQRRLAAFDVAGWSVAQQVDL